MELARLITEVQIATAIIAGLMICLAAFGTALSFAHLGGKFLESIARQPELGPILLMRMFIMAGLIDAFAAISVASGLLLFFGKNPLLVEIVNAAAQKVG